MLRVFLCHDSSDKAFVRDLYERLKNDRFSPWMDEKDLLPGHDWESEIRKAVRSSDIFVICFSGAFLTRSGYTQKELKLALENAERKKKRIFVIPARIDECVVPTEFRRWQSVDLFKEHGYEKLLSALRYLKPPGDDLIEDLRTPTGNPVTDHINYFLGLGFMGFAGIFVSILGLGLLVILLIAIGLLKLFW